MFTWPTPELTAYERKFIRLYREPKLDASGKPNGEYWPGVIKRTYEVELWNNANPDITRMINGPKLVDRVQISRRARVFALTFSGDIYSWFLLISTASGERYTNEPCLVSAMCAGSNFNAEANIGEPLVTEWAVSFGVLIDPNYQLVPNESLFFTGSLAPAVAALDPVPNRTLTIGVHVYEFPGMAG